MKLHNVNQGSPEWHALRNRVKHTASDLAAIRGNSKYKTRVDAIREAATGIKPEISEFQQKKFDEGHATEAKARVIIEAMIGEDLYPSTATTDDEFLLASSDGATMMGDIGYEHKLWNEELAQQIRESNETGVCKLHPMYTDQMDQQIAVYGFEKIIFATSDGTADNMEWMAYHGNEESISRIRADWAQFDIDVANYQHVEIATKPVGNAPTDTLPVLQIEVTGAVTYSNLAAFKSQAIQVIDGIKTELVTDQDFADAEKTVKWLKGIEDTLKDTKTRALAQTESIDLLFRTMDEIAARAATTRKQLDNLVKNEKENRKADLVRAAQAELNDFTDAITKRLGGLLPRMAGDFGGVIKGLKTIESMQAKISAELARVKVEASELGERIAANLAGLDAEGNNWRFLFPDLAVVIVKPVDDFANLLASRIAAHKDAEEKRLAAERERIRQEEVARINAEQAEAARKAQEQARQAQEEANQRAADEAIRLENERKNSVAAANESNQAQTEAVIESAVTTGLGIAQVSVDEQAGISVKHVANDQVIEPIKTMKLGEICAAFGPGFSFTADFLAGLDVHPVSTEKNAKLYDANKFPTICRLIIEHVNGVMQKSLGFKKAA